jgi:hypothetical protein
MGGCRQVSFLIAQDFMSKRLRITSLSQTKILKLPAEWHSTPFQQIFHYSSQIMRVC